MRRPPLTDDVQKCLRKLSTKKKTLGEGFTSLFEYLRDFQRWQLHLKNSNPPSEALEETLSEWCAEAIIDMRMASCMSQEQLADRMNLTVEEIQKFESREYLPTLPELISLILACNAAPWTIFVGIEKLLHHSRKDSLRKRGRGSKSPRRSRVH